MQSRPKKKKKKAKKKEETKAKEYIFRDSQAIKERRGSLFV